MQAKYFPLNDAGNCIEYDTYNASRRLKVI